MKRVAHILLATALCAHTASAQPTAAAGGEPETLIDVSTKAREARLKGDIPTWLDYATRTLAFTPDHPDILISVARASAAAGKPTDAARFLAEAARRGAGIDAGRFAEFKTLAGSPEFAAAAEAIKRNLTPVARAETFADFADRQS